jgi:putative transposase
MLELITEGAEASHSLPIVQMCQVLSVSRAAYYRSNTPGPTSDASMALRDQLQRIALELPAYGYRRITHELQRRGVLVNHKHVLRLMREDNLLCLRKRSWIRTTDPQHHLVIYPNLLPELPVIEFCISKRKRLPYGA